MLTFKRLRETSWLELHHAMQHRHTLLQGIDFAQLSLEKINRAQALKAVFSGKYDYQVFITDCHLRHLNLGSPNFFKESLLPLRGMLERGESGRLAHLDGCIVILNNADIDSDSRMEAYSEFYNNHPETIFIGWDTDNHHTLQISMAFASLVDFYAQTQIENYYDLSRFNPLHAFVPTGLLNISRVGAIELFPIVVAATRSDQIRGYFSHHNPFVWRNKVVATLAAKHANIGFFSENRGPGIEDDYFGDLIGSKLHWIVPTLNDASARIHEILVTGGIPILPQSLRYHPALVGLSSDDVVYYSLSDIVDTRSVIEEGLEKFNVRGVGGVRARFNYAISNHGDLNLMKIMKLAAEFFEFEVL
jgi:hypothetical protein